MSRRWRRSIFSIDHYIVNAKDFIFFKHPPYTHIKHTGRLAHTLYLHMELYVRIHLTIYLHIKYNYPFSTTPCTAPIYRRTYEPPLPYKLLFYAPCKMCFIRKGFSSTVYTIFCEYITIYIYILILYINRYI